MHHQAGARVHVKKEEPSSDEDCVIVEKPAVVKFERPASPLALTLHTPAASSRRMPPVERRSFFQAAMPPSAAAAVAAPSSSAVVSPSWSSSSPSSPALQRSSPSSPAVVLKRNAPKVSSPPAVVSSVARVSHVNDSCLYKPRGTRARVFVFSLSFASLS